MENKSKGDKNTDAVRFLGELFPEIPDKSHLLVWELSSKSSRWFSDISTAATFAQGRNDVYVGCALSPKDFGSKNRCPANQVTAISGLWVDIDYQHIVHKKRNLPSTIEAATRLAKSILPPTVIVSTGHGVQAWWMFKELWVFGNEKERDHAAGYVQSWQAAIRRQAAQKKWEVDATHDLARVLRIPGTLNAKEGKPKLVTVVEADWNKRYDPSDFDQYFAEQLSLGSKVRVSSFANLPKVEIRLKHGPDPKKWTALKSADPRIELSFERKRRDLPDTSTSAYDMSLASFAAQADWTDQEICDLLVAHRIRHDSRDPRLKRPNYFAHTIARARESYKQDEAMARVEDLVDFGVADGVEEGDVEGKKVALIKALGEKLKVPLTRLVRYMTDPPQYRLEIATGQHVILGTVENLIEQRKFRNAVASITGKLIAPTESKRWPKMAQGLLNACYDLDAGMEATDKGSVLLWLTQYFSELPPLKADEQEEAVDGRYPFFWKYRGKKMVCMFLSEFSKWLRIAQNERIDSRRLGILLRGFGGKSKTVKIGKNAVWVWVFDWEKLQKRTEEKKDEKKD